MADRIFLGLGTNLGDRLANLDEAVRRLAAFCQILRCSAIYETEPWGFTDQPLFLNQVVEVETLLEPPALLAAVKSIEVDLGRQPNFRFGPRLIDIDILLFGSRMMQSAALTLPHPMLEQRVFVLVPLVELDSNLIHPLSGRTMQSLLVGLDVSGVKLVQAADCHKETG
jgi:2-amino-4-hydroxy-6-hydroxymethyldihydropteridine diphosphokinase